MFTYFDKTFFKIVGGFAALLCASLVLFWVTAHINQPSQSSGQPTQNQPAPTSAPAPTDLTASQGK